MFYNIYAEERQQKRRRIFWLIVFWLLAIICGVGGFVSVTELYYATEMIIQTIWIISLAISIIGFAGCVYFILMIK
jgi:cell division septal protein FtsQ